MIIHLTSEVAPFYKRGGLGDIVGTLPAYLSERQPNIVISFFYEGRMKGDLQYKGVLNILIQGIQYELMYYHQQLDGVDFYFLNMSDRLVFSDLESGESEQLPEDGDKPYKSTSSYVIYLYFAKAVFQLIDELNMLPEYLIFHDWHVCGCFAFPQLMESLRKRSNFSSMVLIHNYEHQGDILPDVFHLLDQEVSRELSLIFAEYGTATLLSLGLKNADYVATVSSTYADELTHGDLPHTGLKFLKAIRRNKIYALPNGVDYAFWSPQNSPYIVSPYDKLSAAAVKKIAKSALEKELGFTNSDEPVILMMARLTEQKGITLLMDFWNSEEQAMESIQALLDTGIRLVICGRPAGGVNGNIHKRFSAAQKRFSGRFSYISDYNEPVAHRLLAASDAILCPSLYEPCGLVQLYGMAFGTIPVVRPVGGLRDTVISYEEDKDAATGFYIHQFSYESLLSAIRQLSDIYKYQPHQWEKMRSNCMVKDYSWRKMGSNYFDLFDSIEIGNSVKLDSV